MLKLLKSCKLLCMCAKISIIVLGYVIRSLLVILFSFFNLRVQTITIFKIREIFHRQWGTKMVPVTNAQFFFPNLNSNSKMSSLCMEKLQCKWKCFILSIGADINLPKIEGESLSTFYFKFSIIIAFISPLLKCCFLSTFLFYNYISLPIVKNIRQKKLLR